ncbi:MAG TPA: hypothetical protein VER58_05970 [Thermoanaerobaculia bacterium]|nr:hypothetical protein [Thermoanaerobaculia bacterium]
MTLLFAIAVESPDLQLRAEVQKLCGELKAAYDSGDRARVLSHFQYGDTLTPTQAEYSMLGKLRFWDKPIKDIEGKDGVIWVTFTMDPQSDLPAQFATLNFIRQSDGKLVVKSSASPQELEAAKERKQKQEATQSKMASLASELEGRKKVERWPLLERYVREASASPTPPLPDQAPVFPVAECYRGNEAVLFTYVGMFDELVPAAIRFEKKSGSGCCSSVSRMRRKSTPSRVQRMRRSFDARPG